MIKQAIYKWLYALFPRRCELCGEVVALDIARCDDCHNLSVIDGDICIHCGHKKEDCVCKKRKKEYVSVIAPYYYDDNLYKAVHRFKFNGYQELSVAMGKEIANCVRERYADISFDCITFVPLTNRRLKKRGYNQSQLLTDKVSKEINVPVESLLIKVFDNKSQRTTTSYKMRKNNVYGAYDLAEDAYVIDKTILLIDDIKTTGSTVDECAKMLNIFGAKKVYVATLAITKHNKKSKQHKGHY